MTDALVTGCALVTWPLDHLVGGGSYVCAPPGRRTVKAEPLPGSLVTATSPPIMRASLRESARQVPRLGHQG